MLNMDILNKNINGEMRNSMKKLAIIVLCIIVIGVSVYIGYIIYNNTNNNIGVTPNENKVTEISSEKVTDDCTEEYEYEQSIDLLKTSLGEEKISPNAVLTLKKYYKECKHTVIENKSATSSNLVNKTKEELQNEYENWKIEHFSSTEIILSKEFEGKCNEEFILRDVNGKIVIYKLDENDNEIEYEQTEIATDYLTDTDKININKGLKIIGKEELNKVIEDFE